MNTNIILATDSYKLTHFNMYPSGTEKVYSYFEARKGALFNNTKFFGLQSILKKIEGCVVTQEDLDEANAISLIHFGKDLFNYDGWKIIVDEYDGRLPIEIKAVPEGSVIPVGNVLMTVCNTDNRLWWLTNAMESLLTHVWYPSTVATLSMEIKNLISYFLKATSGSTDGIEYMLHDFGYRGASSHESAAIGGAAHLVNFVGTDTLPALMLAIDDYDANPETLGFSVPATEHSIMTSRGIDGEIQIVEDLLKQYPTGILSVVADSYDYSHFVRDIVCGVFKEEIMNRDGVFVVRPDSVPKGQSPESIVLETLHTLIKEFGGTVRNGYKVLDSHVRVIWGDGIDYEGIGKILKLITSEGFCASNMIFGMGGGLLQKVNRDTQRFAFKSSAQYRSGEWVDVFKQPTDITKKSKAGRLALIRTPYDFGDRYDTCSIDKLIDHYDYMQTVFLNGEIVNLQSFDDIRSME